MRGKIMPGDNVITFPVPRPRLSVGLLRTLTERVTQERPDIRDIIADYTEYCVLLGIRPSSRAHYDWAMERLGMTRHRALG
jgi:hypothetical protein